MKIKAFPTLAIVGLASLSPLAFATTIPGGVAATDLIYCTGSSTCLNQVGGATAPVAIDVAGLSSITITASGTISLNSGGNNNFADGSNAGSGSSQNNGYSPYSGINAPGAGYLTGLFTESGDTTTPTSLDYTGGGNATESGTASPLINQTFVVGESDIIAVPTGATELYLGISDACGYGGDPSCYSDNSGAFTVSYTGTLANPGSATPEPSSLVLLGTGLAGTFSAIRRRMRK